MDVKKEIQFMSKMLKEKGKLSPVSLMFEKDIGSSTAYSLIAMFREAIEEGITDISPSEVEFKGATIIYLGKTKEKKAEEA